MRSLFFFHIRQIGVVIMVTGCSLFEYHPYEVRVPGNERDLNAKAIARIQEDTPVKDTLTVILMGDTQRFYDEVEGFVKSANKQVADFVLLAGDLTDFGIDDEYGWIHDIMKRLNKPYVAVIGNHDLSGNGEKVFKTRCMESKSRVITKPTAGLRSGNIPKYEF